MSASNEESQIRAFMRTVRRVSIAFFLGAAAVSYGGFTYAESVIEQFRTYALDGNCGGVDVAGTFYWRKCTDDADPTPAIAAWTQQRDWEEAARQDRPDAIGDIIRKTEKRSGRR